MTEKTDTQLLIEALKFAALKHKDQRRKDIEASPYINHPIALTDVLANECGICDPEILVAAILHDTVEDTETTADELVEKFGPGVARIVMEVTDDTSLSRAERKKRQIEHAPGLSNKAKAVKLADKISNLRDVAQSPPEGWSLERQQQYFDWAKQVVDGLRGQWPELEEIFYRQMQERPEDPRQNQQRA
jgi:guanosine-3',5'-bis(diphosphate) 3'-pyrophosphohydrolase